ncbi:MAG: hypothetical protein ACLTX3_07095 [Lachnospiraceae bacterium]
MRQRFKRGNGEFLAAAVMSIFITSIMILIIAVMQMNFSMNNITKAVTSASRAAYRMRNKSKCRNVDTRSCSGIHRKPEFV